MTVISCPYCGSNMNLPLKFCLSCGRPVSSQDVKRFGGLKNVLKSGITRRLAETPSSAQFDLARKSYGVRRSLRTLAVTLFYILLLVSLYYFAVRFILKQALPGNADVVIRDWLMGVPRQQKPEVEPSTAPAPAPEIKEPEPAPTKQARSKRKAKTKTRKRE